jgi:RND family efflux transporter MFP subunit
MNRKLALLANALALAAVLAGCSHQSASDEGESGAFAANAEVTLTKVTRADIRETVAISGTVAAPPNQDVRVGALVSGRIAEMKVAEGEAEAAQQQAKATLENAQLARKRNEDLFQRGIAARKDFEDARTQESVAAATLGQAEAAVQVAHLQLARTEIHSPLTGRVSKRFVSVGEQVDGNAAQPIAEVANLSEAELLGNLPAAYLSKLHVGETLEIASDALPEKSLSGKIVAISPAVDPATNLGLVRIRIANSAGALRLGMYLTAEIAVADHKNALTTPREAIYRDEKGQAHVYRVEKDKATAIDVTLGILNKDRVEILSGVAEGDTIILTGGYGLPDTAKVHIQK